MKDRSPREGAPETTPRERQGSAQQCSAIVDAVYSYTLRDIDDATPPNNFVHRDPLPSPPKGSLVRIDIGRTRYLTPSQRHAAALLCWGARRVQVVGQSREVEWLRQYIAQYLAEQEEADARDEARMAQWRTDPWGESA